MRCTCPLCSECMLVRAQTEVGTLTEWSCVPCDNQKKEEEKRPPRGREGEVVQFMVGVLCYHTREWHLYTTRLEMAVYTMDASAWYPCMFGWQP
eukprot:m.338501 g.338501  ORF g.338501 m.338501 type:complete len:94 (-) comp27800_c0_seq4:2448-2729(-)